MHIAKAAIRISYLGNFHLWYCISEKKLYRRRRTFFNSAFASEIKTKIYNHHFEDNDMHKQDINLNIFFDSFVDPRIMTYTNCIIYTTTLTCEHYIKMDQNYKNTYDVRNDFQLEDDFIDYLLPTSLYEILSKSELAFGTKRNKENIYQFESSIVAKYENPPKNKYIWSIEDFPTVAMVILTAIIVGGVITSNITIIMVAATLSMPFWAITWALITKCILICVSNRSDCPDFVINLPYQS